MQLVKIGLVLLVAPVLLLGLVHWGGKIAALAGLTKALGLVLYFLGFASLLIGGLLVLGGLAGLLWQRIARKRNA